MYDIIKSVIESGRFELQDMLKKIDTIWIQGDLTEDQKIELVELARNKANPSNSYAPTDEQIKEIHNLIKELDSRVVANTIAIKELKSEEVEPETPSIEEYPEFIQPTGAHNAYNTGDKITYNGVKYVCTMDACVWSPDVYPNAWSIVE